MAENREPSLRQGQSIPTLEYFRGIKHSNVAVGTSVTQIPAANLNFRKGMIVQNKHASNIVYIGGGIPYYITGVSHELYTDSDHDKRSLKWFASSSGTYEWYLATSANANPSLTQITYLYYKQLGSTETLATEGTVGSLAAEHGWGWGTTADISGNTLFVRTDGVRPEVSYDLMYGYYFVLTADDTAATGGLELGPRDSLNITAAGSVRVFAIASGATTAVGILEVV